MLKHIKSNEEWSEKSLGAKGFTLIELLVVIIILGILAAVAIFAIGNIRDNAEESACETEVATVRTALAAYLTQYDGPPTDLAELMAAGNLTDEPSHVDFDTDVSADGTEVTHDCTP